MSHTKSTLTLSETFANNETGYRFRFYLAEAITLAATANEPAIILYVREIDALCVVRESFWNAMPYEQQKEYTYLLSVSEEFLSIWESM